MLITNGPACYNNVRANTTESKEDILLILYESLINSVRMARKGAQENDPKLKGEKISNALAILTELDCALDMENGGEVAENMTGMYRYLINLLTKANIKNDPEPLEEAEKLLSELYDGFKIAAQGGVEPPEVESAEYEINEGGKIGTYSA